MQATASVASAGFGEAVTLQAVVTLVAADGGVVSFSWIQTAGPGVRVNNGTGATASFAAPSVGQATTLAFRVTAFNTAGDTGFADVSVQINADPEFPRDSTFDFGTGGGTSATVIARAGADRSVREFAAVTLDGSASAGSNLAFRWRQASGASVFLRNADTARASFDAPAFSSATGAVNTIEFELTVTDPTNRSSRDRVVITITRDTTSGPNELPRVRIDTTMGSFTIELDNRASPNTVANFLQYIDDNFYDGTIIHRVVPGFVVQGGGYLPGLVEKEVRPAIEGEAPNGLSNIRGTVAMALRAGNADSATSQFFVNLVDNTFLDAQNFTVFGRVIDMTVVDQIGTVETTTSNGFNDVPVTDIIVRDVVRLSN
ncbi:MAG: peptidylprolyl isomerase [Phycisphaerae bacterium]